MKDQALYLEADEDITSAIDKLAKTSGTTVQIVVPKRSTLLQSIINLKLLKKAAADHQKDLVLVTGDKVATDLAARLGLAVAPSVGADAVVGDAAPIPKPDNEDIIEADDPEPTPIPEAVTPPVNAKPKKPLFARKPVAEPIVAAAAAAETETVTSAAEPVAEVAAKPGAKVPNFGRLQRRLVWVGLAIVLIGGFFIYVNLASKATVTLFASGTKVPVNLTFAVDPNQSSSSSAVLAGQTVTYTKNLSQPITPTGTQDAGTKAAGQVTMYNNYDTSSHTLVAGTRLAAPDGKVFLTNADVTIPGETLSGSPASIHPGQATVAVTASQNGDSYNEAPAKYTVVAYTGAMQTDIYGQGAQMSGGTTKTVTVVSQDDVDKAEAAMLAADKDGSGKALDGKVPSGYTTLSGSTGVTAANITSAPAVNAVATSATVTLEATYTELAVKKTDLETLLKGRELAQVGLNNQIYDDGLGSAQITSSGKDTSGHPQFSLSTQAYSGAKIDTVALAKQLAGHKYGDATDLASRQPGVQRVGIALSPAWLPSLPSRAAKITVTIQVASDN